MKTELCLVLKGSSKTFNTLEELRSHGFNATVVSTESLKKAVDYYPEDHHFFNLRHFEQKDLTESILCLFIIDKDRLDELKNLIRQLTNNFNDIKGFMYTHNISDYEGSI